MSDKLIIQSEVKTELGDGEVKKLKETVENLFADINELCAPQVFYQRQSGTVTFGMVVDDLLEKIVDTPGAGRYLAILICSDKGKIISEKFISNPALKVDQGRFGMVVSIFKRNGVNELLLPDKPDAAQKMILDELEMEYALAPAIEIEELRQLASEIV